MPFFTPYPYHSTFYSVCFPVPWCATICSAAYLAGSRLFGLGEEDVFPSTFPCVLGSDWVAGLYRSAKGFVLLGTLGILLTSSRLTGLVTPLLSMVTVLSVAEGTVNGPVVCDNSLRPTCVPFSFKLSLYNVSRSALVPF